MNELISQNWFSLHHSKRWFLTLSIRGEFKRWVIPKGMPSEFNVKILAIELPVEYKAYSQININEGLIARGKCEIACENFEQEFFISPILPVYGNFQGSISLKFMQNQNWLLWRE